MKTEILQQLDQLRSLVVASIPDDAPMAPSGFSILQVYGDNPRCIALTWNYPPAGSVAVLDYQGTNTNPNGPQEWTIIPINSGAGSLGELATLVMQNPVGQSVIFRLRTQQNDGSYSPSSEIPFTA